MPLNLNEVASSKDLSKVGEPGCQAVVSSELINQPETELRTDDQAEKEVHRSMNRSRFPQIFGNVNPLAL